MLFYYLSAGAVLGLAAGFAPGPLLTLVISETLQHGIRSGVKVALAPIITDLPIIAVTLFLLSRLSNFPDILGIISLLGGACVLSMGYAGIRTIGVDADPQGTGARSLAKGVLANALSPHPYLFWFSVGAPTMTRAMGQQSGAAAVFLVSFYLLLVGSKILLALLVGRSRSLLSGRAYLFTMRSLGVALCILAIALFRDGLALLNIL